MASIGQKSESRSSWATQLLNLLGDPTNSTNKNAVVAWEAQEGGGGAFNPLNTTQSEPGATDFNSVGVKNYTSWAQGLGATKQTLDSGYPSIESSLKQGQGLSGPGVGAELFKWSGGGYTSVGSPVNATLTGSPATGGNANTTAAAGCPSFFTDPIGWGLCKGAGGGPVGAFFTDPTDILERIGLVIFGGLLILVGIAILGFGPATRILGMTAGTTRDVRAVGRAFNGGSSAGPPDPAKQEERDRRVALAERNVSLGERKQDFREKRELRLSRTRRHTSGEPNPNPQHA